MIKTIINTPDMLEVSLTGTEPLEIDLGESVPNVTVNADSVSYNQIKDKPKINNVELKGNKTLDELNIQEKGNYPEESLTNTEIENLINNFA